MSAPMEHPIVVESIKGNQSALLFVRGIAGVLHTWDDLIDRDKAVNDAQVHDCFWQALIELPRNAFYRANFDTLNPILVNAIANWRIANELERQHRAPREDLTIAFIVRSSYVDLLTMSALLIGGLEWSVHCGVAIRRWAHSEGFAMYLKNLAAENAARKD